MKSLILSLTVLQSLLLATRILRPYMDPGSGSMLLQILLGGFAGVAVALKLLWNQLGGLVQFGRRRTDDSEPSNDEPGPSDHE